jgi:hypothetical protein
MPRPQFRLCSLFLLTALVAVGCLVGPPIVREVRARMWPVYPIIHPDGSIELGLRVPAGSYRSGLSFDDDNFTGETGTPESPRSAAPDREPTTAPASSFSSFLQPPNNEARRNLSAWHRAAFDRPPSSFSIRWPLTWYNGAHAPPPPSVPVEHAALDHAGRGLLVRRDEATAAVGSTRIVGSTPNVLFLHGTNEVRMPRPQFRLRSLFIATANRQ